MPKMEMKPFAHAQLKRVQDDMHAKLGRVPTFAEVVEKLCQRYWETEKLLADVKAAKP